MQTSLIVNSFGLNKAERLRSKTKIQDLFVSGKTIRTPQIKMIYKRIEHDQNTDHPHMVMFSAPKKQYPKAVERNKRKRHLREAYRLNKTILYSEDIKRAYYYTIIFIYLGSVLLPFKELEKTMVSILNKIK